MTSQAASPQVRKLLTGIPSFDMISEGGIPENRTTLVSGTAGSGKTVLAVQFLAAGIRDQDQPGVFVTFEESAADIRSNMLGFGWDRQATGARCQRERPFLGLDVADQALEVGR